MTLTLHERRLLLRLSMSYQYVRSTSASARRLVELGLAQWGKCFAGGRQKTVLCITTAGRERV